MNEDFLRGIAELLIILNTFLILWIKDRTPNDPPKT